jgi:hypothetical protein
MTDPVNCKLRVVPLREPLAMPGEAFDQEGNADKKYQDDHEDQHP